MPAIVATKIKLIEPQRPQVLMVQMETEDVVPTWRRYNEYLSNKRQIKELRTKAAGASLDKLAEAGDKLERETRILSIEQAEHIATLARGVAREADKLKNHLRLREFEKSLVQAGLATWTDA